MKLFSKCETCKKRRLIIKKRVIILPIGQVALSQKLMCKRCQELVQNAVTKKDHAIQ